MKVNEVDLSCAVPIKVRLRTTRYPGRLNMALTVRSATRFGEKSTRQSDFNTHATAEVLLALPTRLQPEVRSLALDARQVSS